MPHGHLNSALLRLFCFVLFLFFVFLFGRSVVFFPSCAQTAFDQDGGHRSRLS